MTEAPRSERRLSAVVVGAGFGGIAAAIRLRAAGFEDLVVLDRAPRIGGVWHHNVYPGAAGDVPSPLYSYAQNPRWSRRYAAGPEVRDYLERIAGEWGVADRIRLDTEAHAAGWDEQTARWTVETSRGTLEADLLVAACGQLSRPQIPHLPGIERFAGRAFHSAEWDLEFDPRGRRVAVIGTGASAIQFVPAIQPQVAAMTVFQRSAAYVIPKLDRIYRAWHHALVHRSERALRAGRRSIVAISEYSTPAFTEKPGRITPFVLWHRALLRWQVPDPELRRKLAPTDRIGCKRVVQQRLVSLAQPSQRGGRDRCGA